MLIKRIRLLRMIYFCFGKDLRKTDNIAGVLEPMRNGIKPISNEQMKKLFDNGEVGWAESKNPAHLQRTT